MTTSRLVQRRRFLCQSLVAAIASGSCLSAVAVADDPERGTSRRRKKRRGKKQRSKRKKKAPAPADISTLAEEDFEDHLGEVFTISRLGPPVELKLVEIREHDHVLDSVTRPLHIRSEPFSLLFLASGCEILKSGIYEFDHPVLGDLNLFLHEVSADEDTETVHYEVVFN